MRACKLMIECARVKPVEGGAMGRPGEHPQRIVRLVPLREILAAVERHASPVAPREVKLASAIGCVLAADVAAATALPATPVAVRDGWAVRSDLLADAGPYAPAPLAPPPTWVDCGDALPAGCDAVLPADALTMVAGACEAIAAVAPGEGVAPAAFDAAAGTLFRTAGERLRAIDVAVLRGARIARAAVRAPRIGVISTNAQANTAEDAVGSFIADAATAAGAIVERRRASDREGAFAEALSGVTLDAIITIGGTGEGRADRTVQTVATAGELLIHGMGIRPGESGGFALVGSRPVLLLPGRLDAALAVWLVVGRALLLRLTGAIASEPAQQFPLTRKLVSTVSLAEVVLVRRHGEGVEPIAAELFPLTALARALGWVLVPPESEGYASGATVTVNPLP